MFNFIDKNFEKIKDSSKVLCVRPYKKEGMMALFAVISLGRKRYELVQLTEAQLFNTFPSEPLLHFYNEGGMSNLQNFVNLDNYFAFNKEHFVGFGYSEYVDDQRKCILYAKFKDGSATYMSSHRMHRFIRKDIVKLRKFMMENDIDLKNRKY